MLTMRARPKICVLPIFEPEDRAVAQLVARTLGVREVVGSNPASPTILYPNNSNNNNNIANRAKWQDGFLQFQFIQHERKDHLLSRKLIWFLKKGHFKSRYGLYLHRPDNDFMG